MMNKDENLAKAKDFLEKAERLHKGSLSGDSFTRITKVRESIGFMKKAANHFRLAKDWRNAADAFLKAADREVANGNDACAAFIYDEAATMQIKFDKGAAIKSLELKVQASCSEGKISWAADTKRRIGEIYEEENEYLLAAKNYSEAFEFFEMIDFKTPLYRFNLLLKVAELKVAAEASKEHLIEALNIYQNLISKYFEENKEDAMEIIYSRTLILNLANGNIDAATEELQKCVDLNYNWRNYEIANDAEVLIGAFREKDFLKFTVCYCRYWAAQLKKPFEAWNTAVLGRIKAQLGEITQGEAYIEDE